MSGLPGYFPWRPVISMGDGRGGYGTVRMDRCTVAVFDGHTLTRDRYGALYDHGPHGVFSVTRPVGEDEAATVERWREGIRRGWYA